MFTSSLTGQEQIFTEQPIFENEKFGYGCYRIPALLALNEGRVLAFAEGRKEGCSDFGNVDIVIRVSDDYGKTWGPLKVLVDNAALQAGNPAPLVDYLDTRFSEGRIFLFYNTGIESEAKTRNGEGLREVFYITSPDQGISWERAVNITSQVHKPYRPDLNPKYNFREDWRSHANTPGHALQLSYGEHKGRLLVPANHSKGAAQKGFLDYQAYCYFSDDHGSTWQVSDDIQVPSSNESHAAQLANGQLVVNSRYQSGYRKQRVVSLSSDGGQSWDTTYFDSQLYGPICQASILRTEIDGAEVLLFSNPKDSTQRKNMTIQVSWDGGFSWTAERRIRRGNSAYSDLAVLGSDTEMIGLLYEHGNDGGIHFARFNHTWLLGDIDPSERITKVKNQLQPGQIKVLTEPSRKYAPASALTNKIRGSLIFSDDNWMGFEGTDAHFEMDLAKGAEQISIGLLIDHASWIFEPKEIRIDFKDVAGKLILSTQQELKPFTKNRRVIHDVEFEVPKRTVAANVFIQAQQKCPKWHPGAGLKAWLFIDEIIVD